MIEDESNSGQLDRFLQAQENDFAAALSEVRSGRKHSHWMWYIFPQLRGLGHSSTSQFYAINDISEAKAFLAHPVLGRRLREITEALLLVEGKTAEEIFGFPDVLKLRSCATLFAHISEKGSIFERVLEKYYHSERDETTLHLLKQSTE